MAQVGRPTDYTKDLSDIICAKLAEGESMRSISRDESMPCSTTMFRWLREDEEFQQQYAQAKLEGHNAWFEDIMDISDDGSNDWMERNNKDGENIGWQVNGEAIQRSKLRVDSRKWALSKLMPKKYGDKIHTEHSGTLNDFSNCDTEELDRLMRVMKQKLDNSKQD